jgi:photosystem II stability/assembly factor-like uncharacterized protein
MRTISMLIPGIWCLLLLPVVVLTQPAWESLNGPSGGAVHSIAVAEDGSLYIVASYHAIFKSEDEGEHWEELEFPGLEPVKIHALASGTLLVCNASGTWRSVDEGGAWSLVTDLPLRSIVECGDGSLLGAAQDGLYRSIDDGCQWTAAALAGHFVNEITRGVANDLWAACTAAGGVEGAVFRSLDHGNSWTLVLEGPPNATSFSSVKVCPSGAVVVINQQLFYRSYDQGLTWESWTNPGYACLWSANGGCLYGSLFEEGVFRSCDEGQTWFSMGPSGTVLCVAENQEGWLFAGFASDRGIARWHAAYPEWAFLNEDLVVTTLDGIRMDSEGILYGLSKHEVLNRFDPQTQKWSVIPLPASYHYFDFFIAPGDQLILASTEALLISSDGGYSWDCQEGSSAYEMAFGKDGAWYASGKFWMESGLAHGVFRSIDQGHTWTWASPPIPEYSWIQTLFVTEANALFLHYGSGMDWATFRSEDGGATWMEILPFSQITGLVFAEGPDGLTAIGYQDQGCAYRLFRSFDDGHTWLCEGAVNYNAMELLANSKGHLFLNDGSCIRKSDDGGMNWSLFSIADFFGYGLMHMLLSAEEQLYVSYPNHGVWRTATPTTPVVEVPEMNALPLAILPNPVEGQAAVRFYLPEGAAVRLECFDAQGRWMSLLKEGYLPAGQHELAISSGDWPAGIYFLRLSGDAGMGMVRMIKK